MAMTRRTRPAAAGATVPQSPGCPLGELFGVLGRTHTLRILHLFLGNHEKPLRFVDVQSRLHLSPNTVSERLKGLVEAGLLSRTVFHEIPPRVEYAATHKLVDLGTVFDQLQHWAAENDLHPAAASGLAVGPGLSGRLPVAAPREASARPRESPAET